MLREYIKERNGWKSVELDKLAIGETFLFNNEANDAQGHYVTDIFDNGRGDIIICYIPEWTPVANHSMFRYGSKEIRIKC